MRAPAAHPGHRTVLAVEELPAPGSFLALAQDLNDEPYPWLLESALPAPPLGRFSFAGSDPYLVLRCFGDTALIDVRRAVRPELPAGERRVSGHPFDVLRALLPARPEGWPDSLPPFCGGAVGLFGYELGGFLERLPPPPPDPLGLPDLALLFVDRVLAFDHGEDRLLACGLGFDRDPARARGKAQVAASALGERVRSRLEVREPDPVVPPPLAREDLDARVARLRLGRGFDAPDYAKAISRVLEEIQAGNVYQACLTQRLDVPYPGGAFALHRALRELSPAPFAACLELPGASVVSSSPERFLRVDGAGRVESRPIKGTRPRGRDGRQDQALRAELAGSAKERAENLMIVDLVRNDLGRVCATGSVHVPELMAIESYATVFQMVSTVRGRLRPDRDALDAVVAAFPPGSMTGAPKIAAMSLLSRLERCRRGFYAGALGYLDARGGLDLSVVIRTAILRNGVAHVHTGGAIVADSDPASEYAEAMHKARAVLAALASAGA